MKGTFALQGLLLVSLPAEMAAAAATVSAVNHSTYGAYVDWIRLGNVFAHVQSDSNP